MLDTLQLTIRSAEILFSQVDWQIMIIGFITSFLLYFATAWSAIALELERDKDGNEIKGKYVGSKKAIKLFFTETTTQVAMIISLILYPIGYIYISNIEGFANKTLLSIPLPFVFGLFWGLICFFFGRKVLQVLVRFAKLLLDKNIPNDVKEDIKKKVKIMIYLNKNAPASWNASNTQLQLVNPYAKIIMFAISKILEDKYKQNIILNSTYRVNAGSHSYYNAIDLRAIYNWEIDRVLKESIEKEFGANMLVAHGFKNRLDKSGLPVLDGNGMPIQDIDLTPFCNGYHYHCQLSVYLFSDFTKMIQRLTGIEIDGIFGKDTMRHYKDIMPNVVDLQSFVDMCKSGKVELPAWHYRFINWLDFQFPILESK